MRYWWDNIWHIGWLHHLSLRLPFCVISCDECVCIYFFVNFCGVQKERVDTQVMGFWFYLWFSFLFCLLVHLTNFVFLRRKCANSQSNGVLDLLMGFWPSVFRGSFLKFPPSFFLRRGVFGSCVLTLSLSLSLMLNGGFFKK